jgi:hypothetical protein
MTPPHISLCYGESVVGGVSCGLRAGCVPTSAGLLSCPPASFLALLLFPYVVAVLGCADDDGKTGRTEGEPNDTLFEATNLGALSVGDKIDATGFLTADDTDWFGFAIGDENLKVKIRVEAEHEADPDFVVLAGDGILRVNGWTWDPSVEEALAVLDRGDYLLRLDSADDSSAAYRLEIEGLNGGIPLTSGQQNTVKEAEPNDSLIAYGQELPGNHEWVVEGTLGGHTGLIDAFVVPAESGTLGVWASWDDGEDIDLLATRSWEDGVWDLDLVAEAMGVTAGQDYFWAAIGHEPKPKAVGILVYCYVDTPEPIPYKLYLRYEAPPAARTDGSEGTGISDAGTE